MIGLKRNRSADTDEKSKRGERKIKIEDLGPVNKLAQLLKVLSLNGYINEDQQNELKQWNTEITKMYEHKEIIAVDENGEAKEHAKPLEERNPCHSESIAPCYECAVLPLDDSKTCKGFCKVKGKGVTYRCKRYISIKGPGTTCWDHNPFKGIEKEVLRKVMSFTITSCSSFDDEELDAWLHLPSTIQSRGGRFGTVWKNEQKEIKTGRTSANVLKMQFGLIANLEGHERHTIKEVKMDLEVCFNSIYWDPIDSRNKNVRVVFGSPAMTFICQRKENAKTYCAITDLYSRNDPHYNMGLLYCHDEQVLQELNGIIQGIEDLMPHYT